MQFTDGSSGVGVLKSSGVASVTWSAGDTTYLISKDNQWYDPYACTYGMDDGKSADSVAVRRIGSSEAKPT